MKKIGHKDVISGHDSLKTLLIIIYIDFSPFSDNDLHGLEQRFFRICSMGRLGRIPGKIRPGTCG